ERDEPLAHTALLLLTERITPDEVALVQLRYPAESRLQRSATLVEVIAVEDVSHLETEGVARAEPDGHHALLLPCLEAPLPHVDAATGGNVQLEAVLARVPGATDDRAHAGDLAFGEVVVRDGIELRLGQLLENPLGAGALQCEQCDLIGAIDELCAEAVHVLSDVVAIAVPVGRVHDDHVVILEAVDDAVVDH